MTKKEELIQHALTGYHSSPVEFTERELDIFEETDFCCYHCGSELIEGDDFPSVIEDSAVCEDCEDEHYREVCSICEDSFEKALKAEDYYFCLITDDATKEYPAGIYRTLEWPYYFAPLIGRGGMFYPGAVKLLRKIDLKSIKRAEVGKQCEDVSSGEICPDCRDIYLQKKRYFVHWRRDRVDRNITVRGYIEKGKGF